MIARFMRFAALGLECGLAACSAAPKTPVLTPDERRLQVESCDYVWSTVRDILWELVGRFKQSHFQILPADLYEPEAAGSTGTGAGTPGVDARVIAAWHW